MAAVTFPGAPSLNQIYPAGAGTAGVSQWKWDGVKWNTVPVFVRTNSQLAYNSYVWPVSAGTPGYQLQTDGVGGLSWELEANNNIQAIGITPLPDGTNSIFTLVELGTFTSYTPVPATNIIVFLGGVPQTPAIAYSIVGDQIEFTDSPPAGTTFYAISSTVVV